MMFFHSFMHPKGDAGLEHEEQHASAVSSVLAQFGDGFYPFELICVPLTTLTRTA